MKAVKILLGLLAVVVAVIDSGAIYVSTLDFNRRKDGIQEQVKKSTGLFGVLQKVVY
jgi:uncharacterized protein involved in outer membrane biogenesis